jgi:hypothetical protein
MTEQVDLPADNVEPTRQPSRTSSGVGNGLGLKTVKTQGLSPRYFTPSACQRGLAQVCSVRPRSSDITQGLIGVGALQQQQEVAGGSSEYMLTRCALVS